MPAKKVLILAGDFTEDLELYFAMQVLQMVGHTVHSACPGKKGMTKLFCFVFNNL